MKKTSSPSRTKRRSFKFSDAERGQLAAALAKELVIARPAFEEHIRQFQRRAQEIVRELRKMIADPAIRETGLQLANRFAAWEAEATALFVALNREGDSFSDFDAYVRTHPPSAGAIAFLILLAQKKSQSEKQQLKARQLRKSSLLHQIRLAGVTRYSELKTKAPQLVKDGRYSKAQLMQAISRAKAAKKRLP